MPTQAIATKKSISTLPSLGTELLEAMKNGQPILMSRHNCLVWFALLPTGTLFPIRISMLPDIEHIASAELKPSCRIMPVNRGRILTHAECVEWCNNLARDLGIHSLVPDPMHYNCTLATFGH